MSENLPKTVTILKKNDKTYYIIGTAHISQKSVEDVETVIDEIKPDTVCVELCQMRYDVMVDKHRWEKLDIFQIIKQKKMLFLLANLALGAFQRRIGEKLGVEPGGEFLAATKAAKKINADIVLADRNIQATLKRTWANLRFWKKIQIMSAIIGSLFMHEEVSEEDIEKMKEKDQLNEIMKEFAKDNPEVKASLIDERDQFLMSSIQEAPGKKIVGVVGAGHVEGMQQYFGQKIDREALNEIPAPSFFSKAFKWVIPTVVLVFFAWGLYQRQGQSFEDMLYAWILPNSLFCALATLIAGGRIWSIITAFFVSPLTSLNPALPAGVLVGLVEAWFRRPTVKDCQNIQKDVTGIKGVYKNRFTRVLLVGVMANFGSAVGAWIGLSWLFSLIV